MDFVTFYELIMNVDNYKNNDQWSRSGSGLNSSMEQMFSDFGNVPRPSPVFPTACSSFLHSLRDAGSEQPIGVGNTTPLQADVDGMPRRSASCCDLHFYINVQYYCNSRINAIVGEIYTKQTIPVCSVGSFRNTNIATGATAEETLRLRVVSYDREAESRHEAPRTRLQNLLVIANEPAANYRTAPTVNGYVSECTCRLFGRNFKGTGSHARIRDSEAIASTNALQQIKQAIYNIN